jgi:hypothetical protein
MTDFKVKIGAKESVLDVQVIVLPLLSYINRGIVSHEIADIPLSH